MNPTESPDNDANADNYTSAKGKGKNICWTIDMDRILTDVLLEQFQRGNKTLTGWKPIVFGSAIRAIKQNYGVSVTKDNVLARLKTWKKHYRTVTELLKQSGFRWNEARKMIEVDNDVWNNYLKSHPKAWPYRSKVILNFRELETIIGDKHTDGEGVKLGKKLDREMATGEIHGRDPISDNEGDEDVAKKGEVNGDEFLVIGEKFHTNGDSVKIGKGADQEIEANGNAQSTTHVANNKGLEDFEDGGEIEGNEVNATNKVGSQLGRARSCASSAIKQPPIKKRRNDAFASALTSVVDLLKSMADAYTRSDVPTVEDVRKLCIELTKIPDLEQSFILQAIDMLVADKTKERVFYGLPDELKKPWLLMHLSQFRN